jgi:hypothetical protein
MFSNTTYFDSKIHLVENKEILKVYPIYITKQEKTNHVDLLIIKDELMNSHYCWIKNFEKLVSNQISKNEQRLYICKKC